MLTFDSPISCELYVELAELELYISLHLVVLDLVSRSLTKSPRVGLIGFTATLRPIFLIDLTLASTDDSAVR